MNVTRAIKAVVLSLFVAAVAFADATTPAPSATPAPMPPASPLKVGDPAPDFSLPYATRDSVSSVDLKLSSLYGKGNIVLAFYPADWSGGCTKEVCMMRDNFSALGALNAQVLGLSGDYVFSHYEWAKHHNLPFALVSDHKHEVARLYGSYHEPSGHDRRTVYVIDKGGKIAYMDMAYSSRDSVSFGKLQAALKDIK